MPDDGTDYVLEVSDGASALTATDGRYMKEVTDTLMKVVMALRKRRDPHAPPLDVRVTRIPRWGWRSA